MNQKAIIGKTFLSALAVVFVFFSTEHAFAQIDEVLIVKQKARTAIRPKAKPTMNRVDVVRKVSIVRVEKKNRKNYKAPPVAVRNVRGRIPKPSAKRIQEPLLAVQLRLMLVNRDGSESEANPLATFTPADRLRLSVKANQRGFLYIIRQKTPESEGEIVFPTSLVNAGKNLISANYEYVIPNNCPKDAVPNPRDCALIPFPYNESPEEFFTLIFTRDQLVDLPDAVKNTRVSLKNLMTAGKLPTKTLIDLIEGSNQDLISQNGDTTFSVRIVNQNANDNEEIIETFILNKTKK